MTYNETVIEIFTATRVQGSSGLRTKSLLGHAERVR
jgi:hypothetical protein